MDNLMIAVLIIFAFGTSLVLFVVYQDRKERRARQAKR